MTGSIKSVSGGAVKAPPSIWIFLVIDSITFGLLFLVFMVERLQQRELFSASAVQLDPLLGLINTLILITGSWLVARAVVVANAGERRRSGRILWLAIMVSSGFALVKVIEYGAKIDAGIGLLTNDFFTFYFALTGFHLFHYLLGMVAMITLAVQSTKTSDPEKYRYWLESAALFWHVVDLLWVFLFTMLYLLGVQ